MLSTSILYCNELNDKLLNRIEDSSGPPSTRNGSNAQTSLLSSTGTTSQLRSIEIEGISVLSDRSTIASSQSQYNVRYLGCNTCDPRSHKLDNGISSYQKPLLELYAAVLRRSVVLRSLYQSVAVVNQVAELSSHGIVVAERDKFSHVKVHPPQRPNSSASAPSSKPPVDTVVTKVITPLSNILLWAAVKFQHRSTVKKVKNSSAKRRQIGVAFVPLSCSDAVLDKNAFVTLTSKQRFLLGRLPACSI